MRNITQGARDFSKIEAGPGRLALWNRRLQIAAIVLVLWAASVVALQASGPEAQALLAGEGLLISTE